VIAAPYRARAFGLDWTSDIALPYFDMVTARAEPGEIALRRVAELPPREGLHPMQRGEINADGFRFRWADCVAFDVAAPARIDYAPGADWQGALPAAFYSTVAALLMACRGSLPFHASAIEYEGRAFLLAGDGGAGKSTLAAELLASGARLIGDDLTVVIPPAPGGDYGVVRGRPAMRLHPDTSAHVDAAHRETVPDDPRGKLLVRPNRRAPDAIFPLAGLLLLEDGAAAISRAELLVRLPGLLFRPRWCARLPGSGTLRAHLLDLTKHLRAVRLPPVAGFDGAARRMRTDQALAAMAALATGC
jgi:hypothetical protein